MNAALPAQALKETAAWDNPMGLMGFEFVEFTSPQPGVLEAVFEKLGFTLVPSTAPRMWCCTARTASTSF